MKANRVRDYLIYISIGLALVASGMWYATPGRPDLPKSAWKWIGLALSSPILFGYAAVDYRPDWKRLRFWGVMLALLLTHLGLFAIALTHVQNFGNLFFVLLFPIEHTGIKAALMRAGYKPINNHL